MKHCPKNISFLFTNINVLLKAPERQTFPTYHLRKSTSVEKLVLGWILPPDKGLVEVLSIDCAWVVNENIFTVYINLYK